MWVNVFIGSLIIICLWDAVILPCAILPVLRFFSKCYSCLHPSSFGKEEMGMGECGPMNLNSRSIVLVTGAARIQGIGFHIAQGFLHKGFSVIICDIDAKGLSLAKQALNPRGEFVDFLQTSSREPQDINRSKGNQFLVSMVFDVSDPIAVKKAREQIDAALKRFHRGYFVDILVQNAGIVTGKAICNASALESRRTLAVNLLSHFYGLKEFLPAMMKCNRGFIITVASMMGHIGGAQLGPYCASKWGLLGLDESLRMELRRSGKSGVRTLLVCPYVVSTGMFGGAFSGGRITGQAKGGNSSFRCFIRSVRDLLIPPLTAKSVAWNIVSETIERRNPSSWYARCTCGARGSTLILPRRLALMPAMLRLLPVGLQEWVLDLAGGVHGMDGFFGYACDVNKRTS